MTDEEYRDLIERAHNIRELQLTPGWETWNNHLHRRLEAKRREMLAGKDTLEAYRYTAGWIEGCAYALDALGELERQVKREQAQRQEAKAET